MKITVVAVGSHMHQWVTAGIQEYQKRLPAVLNFSLVEVPLSKRGKSGSVEAWLKEEGKRTLEVIKPGSHIIALDVKGKSHTTESLAESLQDWIFAGKEITLLIGGPDGLAPECLQAATSKWSLSALTLPHPLVRVILVEQLYRAWTLLQGHPYHRA